MKAHFIACTNTYKPTFSCMSENLGLQTSRVAPAQLLRQGLTSPPLQIIGKKHPSATKPHQIAVNPHSAVRCVVAALLGSRATQSSGRSLATARKLWVARKRRSSASTSPRHSQREVTAAYCIEDRICCAVSDARVFGLME